MPHIPPAADWLAIELACARTKQQVVFALTFRNTDAQPQQLLFSNLSRKAELAGLHIRRPDNSLVEPERKFIGRAAAFTEPGRWLQPGETWTHELVANLAAGTLDFPGALYHLQPGQPYRAHFAYQRVPSNEVEFVV